jgi:CRP-like cAMP-binding protein
MGSTDHILPVYDALTADQIRKINDNSMTVNHKKGESLFSEDKPVSHLMFLSSGLVKIFKDGHQKKTTILRIAGPGNYIGLFSVFYANRYQFSASAIEDSEVLYISMSVLHEVLVENGLFAVQMMQLFSKEGMGLLNKLIFFPQKQVPGRLAEVLLFFSTDIYMNDDFDLPLSRQEIADLVYSTKESVSRTLTEFKNDRMIEIDDRKIQLKSIDLLKVLSKLG